MSSPERKNTFEQQDEGQATDRDKKSPVTEQKMASGRVDQPFGDTFFHLRYSRLLFSIDGVCSGTRLDAAHVQYFQPRDLQRERCGMLQESLAQRKADVPVQVRSSREKKFKLSQTE